MIEFEYWLLLLFPLFFVLGWAAARIDIRHLVKESRSLPRSYFQGLNFLLNDFFCDFASDKLILLNDNLACIKIQYIFKSKSSYNSAADTFNQFVSFHKVANCNILIGTAVLFCNDNILRYVNHSSCKIS